MLIQDTGWVITNNLQATEKCLESDLSNYGNRVRNRMSNNSYTTVQVQLAITSIWKVQCQQFEHFSVANNELFHMVWSTQKLIYTQNRPCHGY